MTIVDEPLLGIPYWTAYSPVDGDSSPVDPLRFDTYAERVGNHLFPGITNRVERARYFGMVAAGIEAASSDVGHLTGREQVRTVRQRFTRFEAAWAFAVLASRDGQIKERPEGATRASLTHEFRGLRGANRVLGYWHQARDQPTIDARGGYQLLQAQEAQGGLGAYLVSLREHGFVRPDRLELTGPGRRLAEAFRGNAKPRHVEALELDGERDLKTWQEAGEHFTLARLSSSERILIREALFAGHRELGRFIALLPQGMAEIGRAHDAFVHVSAGSSHLAEPARYVLAFDEFRRASLRLFSTAGRALAAGTGPQAIADLVPVPEANSLNADVKTAARALGDQPTLPRLEPIAVLCAEIAAAPPSNALACLVAFHHREGRQWVEDVGGGRVQLGTPGAFQDPGDGFHGYTLNAALSVYDDLERTAQQ